MFLVDVFVFCVFFKDNENDMISGMLVRIVFLIIVVSLEMDNVNFDLKIWFKDLFFIKFI